MSTTATPETIELPQPKSAGGMPLHEVLARRRSRREYLDRGLTAEQIGQLCWAGQGITSAHGFRTAPSAGALYPIVLFVADERGVFEYQPQKQRLVPRVSGDQRRRLERAALGQDCVGSAPVCLIVTYDPGRLSGKYGRRSERYCWLEAGHVAQNILLQATSMDLASAPIGAFHDQSVAKTLQLPSRLHPAYLLPIGYPVEE